MLKSKKEEVVEDLRDRLKRAQFNVLTDFKGLNVAQMTRLRREIKEVGGELIVVKNTLLKLAAAQTESAQLQEFFSGPTAVTLGYDNPVELAKVLTKFAKDSPDFKLKAGVLNYQVISDQEITELSKLPDREVLLARLLASMQGVPTALVNVLSGIIRQLLYTLKAIEEQKSA